MLRFCAAVVFFCAVAAHSAQLALETSDKEPPKELDESMRALLQPRAIQLLQGDKPVLEFWLAKEVPLQSKPGSPATALDTVKAATVLGAVAVASARRDYRDDELAAGVYTMRFALQPQDGNHSGSAEFAYFAALVPAKLDTKPEGIKDYKELMKASSKETSTDHPVIVSLRPVSAIERDAPKLVTPAPEHKAVRVRLTARGPETSAICFDIVYEGKGHK